MVFFMMNGQGEPTIALCEALQPTRIQVMHQVGPMILYTVGHGQHMHGSPLAATEPTSLEPINIQIRIRILLPGGTLMRLPTHEEQRVVVDIPISHE
ncbi:unnamed protein product [Rhizoctonia solani]|uniref:Uncharacterized protein n=1 Tax=Rhizoctonia solani TaxID=456999 RepID=A0A8H2XQY5_9AGAM|nr:unnamed protein product [Rhizoctonia solani]